MSNGSLSLTNQNQSHPQTTNQETIRARSSSTTQRFEIAAATDQLRKKHRKLLSLHQKKAKLSSSSAPASPIQQRKLLPGDARLF